MSNTITIKGHQVTSGIVLAGDTEIMRIGRNGRRHLIAEARRDGVEFTLRIDPNEDYTVIA